LDHNIQKKGIERQLGTKEEDAEYLEGFWWDNLQERHYFKVLSVDRRTILKRIFKKKDSCLNSITFGSGERQIAGCCEHIPKPFGFLKCGIFLD